MKLKKLRLHQLNRCELESRQMGLLKGGSGCCACACAGPSSTFWNRHYNDEAGYSQSGGYGTCACCCTGVLSTLSTTVAAAATFG